MNIVHITQIININSRKKIMYRFAETFDGIMKSNCPTYEKFKNLYWKLLLTWLLKTNATMTTTTRDSRDNEKWQTERKNEGR